MSALFKSPPADDRAASTTAPGTGQTPYAARRQPQQDDPFELAAARTRQGVQPEDGRGMGLATIVPEGVAYGVSSRIAGAAAAMVHAAVDAPHLMSDVVERRVDPMSPDTIGRSFEIAAAFAGGGLLRAERGALGTAGGRLTPRPPPRFPGLAQARNVRPATFGKALSNDYRATFLNAHPELEGKVWVHHGVPQRALSLYPGAVTETEIHSYENLRGIPLDVNRDVHLSQITKEWNDFYHKHPDASKNELLDFATDIDGRFGHYFNPQRELQ
jgi:hypothetical protein